MAKHVFLVMSYGRPESQDVYETIVSAGEKAGRTLGDSVLTTRADDTVPKGSIVEHVHNHIRDADLIIGDTSGENPNVMWELGFAAALAKRCSLLLRLRRTFHSVPKATTVLSYTALTT